MKTMNPEERFERIEHQLEFLAVSIQSHDAQIAENSKHIADNSKQIAENSRQIAENSRQIAVQSGQIAELTELTLRIGRIAEAQANRIDEGFARLTESQRRADERLNALINVVDRHFSNGRN